jgi:uncharacterized GH25 family protein
MSIMIKWWLIILNPITKMRLTKIIFTILCLFISSSSFAHYMWLETVAVGERGKAHTVNVYFGEYTYGVIEDPKGENFEGVKHFNLWAIAPSGTKIPIETSIKANAFEGSFIPTEDGTYTVVLNNDEIDVIDYSQYDFGIFKTHYHSTAKVVVGNRNFNTAADNKAGLVIVNTSEETAAKDATVSLQVRYKDQPIAAQEVTIFVADLWSKKLMTDEEGRITFTLPWKTKYTFETTKKDEVPGIYREVDYEFVWHCATYCINL